LQALPPPFPNFLFLLLPPFCTFFGVECGGGRSSLPIFAYSPLSLFYPRGSAMSCRFLFFLLPSSRFLICNGYFPSFSHVMFPFLYAPLFLFLLFSQQLVAEFAFSPASFLFFSSRPLFFPSPKKCCLLFFPPLYVPPFLCYPSSRFFTPSVPSLFLSSDLFPQLVQTLVI